MCHTSYIDAPKKLIKVAENTWFEDKVGQNKKPSRNEHRDENCSAGPSTKSFVSFWFVFVFSFITISRGYQDLWTRNIVPHQKREKDQKPLDFGLRGKKLFQNFLLLFSSPHEKHRVTAVTHSSTTPFSSFLMAVASFLLFKHLWGCLNRKLTLVSCPAKPLWAVSASSPS